VKCQAPILPTILKIHVWESALDTNDLCSIFHHTCSRGHFCGGIASAWSICHQYQTWPSSKMLCHLMQRHSCPNLADQSLWWNLAQRTFVLRPIVPLLVARWVYWQLWCHMGDAGWSQLWSLLSALPRIK
jgi:hypothetical protein